jgi:membrane associated rhomboid family serine protease
VVIPLHDDNPTTTKPRVTVGIMIACTVIYVFQHLLLSREGATHVIYALGVIPALLTGQATADFSSFPPALTVLTSMFVHGGFWHLAGNMLYLWIFGNNVEEAMGHVKFLAFYLLCGAAAVAAQVLPNTASEIPMVGASGAISGVMGAYFVMYPHSRVLTLVFFFLVEVPAIFFLGIYFVMQVLSGVGSLAASNAAGGGTAFWAHVGGFIFGAMMGAVLRARGYRRWEHDDAWLNERRY